MDHKGELNLRRLDSQLLRQLGVTLSVLMACSGLSVLLVGDQVVW